MNVNSRYNSILYLMTLTLTFIHTGVEETKSMSTFYVLSILFYDLDEENYPDMNIFCFIIGRNNLFFTHIKYLSFQ